MNATNDNYFTRLSAINVSEYDWAGGLKGKAIEVVVSELAVSDRVLPRVFQVPVSGCQTG